MFAKANTFKENSRTCYQQEQDWHAVWAVADISKLRNTGASEQPRYIRSLLLISREIVRTCEKVFRQKFASRFRPSLRDNEKNA